MKKCIGLFMSLMLVLSIMFINVTPVNAAAAEPKYDKSNKAFYAYGWDVSVDYAYDDNWDIIPGTLEVWCISPDGDCQFEIPDDTTIYINGGTTSIENGSLSIYCDKGTFDFSNVENQYLYLSPSSYTTNYIFNNVDKDNINVEYTYGIDIDKYGFINAHPMIDIQFDMSDGGKIIDPWGGISEYGSCFTVSPNTLLKDDLKDDYQEDAEAYFNAITNPSPTTNGAVFKGWWCEKTHSFVNLETLKADPAMIDDEIYGYGCIVLFAKWEESTPGENATRLFTEGNKIRSFGANRYVTAIATAENLKKALDITKFETIVVASGLSDADALAGGYLANKYNAPMLLTDSGSEAKVAKYIKDNLNENGKVYILGGEGVVSASMFDRLDAFCYVERLYGKDRYGTNLAILENTGANAEDILVCTGLNFADSLSASAVDCPILLVNNATKTLTAEQKEFLEWYAYDKNFVIVGGTGAVDKEFEKQLERYSDGKISRLAGTNRYETSLLVSKKYFNGTHKNVTLAYGNDFPDGLSGAPLASVLDAPLLLAVNSNTSYAQAYVKAANAENIITFGGNALISDKSVNAIMDK